MKIAQMVAEVLDKHITMEVESIDRMYLNVYMPQLQHASGADRFFRYHRKQSWASSALMAPRKRPAESAVAVRYRARFVAARRRALRRQHNAEPMRH